VWNIYQHLPYKWPNCKYLELAHFPFNKGVHQWLAGANSIVYFDQGPRASKVTRAPRLNQGPPRLMFCKGSDDRIWLNQNDLERPMLVNVEGITGSNDFKSPKFSGCWIIVHLCWQSGTFQGEDHGRNLGHFKWRSFQSDVFPYDNGLV
jgi:hypothetical protein